MSKLKRAFDLVCASSGLVLLSPLLLLIAIGIYCDDRQGVLFRQQRVGRHGRPFLIWKFRTMRTNAELVGGQLTIGADARVTRVGRILRATKLDELPQLANVVCNHMSLVGPRPEVPRFVALYTEKQRDVLERLPGITDPASVLYRDEGSQLAAYDDPQRAYVEVLMPRKIEINLWYAAHATLWTDVRVILATLGIARGSFWKFLAPVLSSPTNLSQSSVRDGRTTEPR